MQKIYVNIVLVPIFRRISFFRNIGTLEKFMKETASCKVYKDFPKFDPNVDIARQSYKARQLILLDELAIKSCQNSMKCLQSVCINVSILVLGRVATITAEKNDVFH